MLTVTYNGVKYQCATAYMGEDSVRLVDENGVLVADFEGVRDFRAFTCVDEIGEEHPWIACPSENECYPVVVGADGKARKGPVDFSKISSIIDWRGDAESDMPQAWLNIGLGVAYVTKGTLDNQPCEQGYLFNLVADKDKKRLAQLLISTDASEPNRMWMRKNLVIGEATMSGYREIESTTEWDPGQYGNYWQQLLSDTDRAKTVSIVGSELTEDYHFGDPTSDSFYALNARHYWPIITGNLSTYIIHPNTNMERVCISVGPDISLVKVHASVTCLAWSEDVDVTLSIEHAISNGLGGFTPKSCGQATQHIRADKSGTLTISNVIGVNEGDALYLKVTSSSYLTLVAYGTQFVVEAVG